MGWSAATVGICAAIRVIGVEAPQLWFPKRFSFDTTFSEAEDCRGHLLSLEVPTRGWFRSLGLMEARNHFDGLKLAKGLS